MRSVIESDLHTHLQVWPKKRSQMMSNILKCIQKQFSILFDVFVENVRLKSSDLEIIPEKKMWMTIFFLPESSANWAKVRT